MLEFEQRLASFSSSISTKPLTYFGESEPFKNPMKPQVLRPPAEMIKRGLVTREKMEEELNHVRSLLTQLREDYPNATFVLDAANILRVEATEEDAGEIDSILQELLSVYTPFSIQLVP